jgi:hypothetical protein
MTNMKLNRKNYSYWARSVEVFLKDRGLFPHLTSSKPKGIAPSLTSGKPEGIAPSLWEQEDNQIISLMLNSIDSHIGSS